MRTIDLKQSQKSTSILIIAAFLLLPSWSAPVSAKLYKCTNADGNTEYKDSPCQTGQQKVLATAKKNVAGGLHRSWFGNTVIGAPPVSCTVTNCTCGEHKFSVDKDKNRRLMTSLRYLPNNWATYDDMYKDYLAQSSRVDADREELKKMACLIAWRKKDIRELYPEISEQIIGNYDSLKTEYTESQCPPDFKLTLRIQNGLEKAPCVWAGSYQASDLNRRVDRAKRSYEELMSLTAKLKKPKPRAR